MNPHSWLAGKATAFAGLFFLVPVLERLGLSARLEASPSLLEALFPVRLLCALGAHAGMTDHDPAARVLRGEDEEARRSDREGKFSGAWFPSEQRVLPSMNADGGGHLLRAWVSAVRGWCRRPAGIELCDLIRRPGLIHATRTHLDVVFELRHADLRMRRAGLDIDPGWVPWLGRVVLFHYVEDKLERKEHHGLVA